MSTSLAVALMCGAASLLVAAIFATLFSPE